MLHPREMETIRRDFDRLVNLTPAELRRWLETPESKKVGMIRNGETESVGRQSARRILQIRDKPQADLDDSDYAHMRKVIGYCRRHLAQRPWGEIENTRWRWSLMNWGHDPLKTRDEPPHGRR